MAARIAKQWYAVAYDVAGGVRIWSGPHLWAEARRRAQRMERGEYVSRAHATMTAPMSADTRIPVTWNRDTRGRFRGRL